MSETRLYGILLADGTVSQEWTDNDEDSLALDAGIREHSPGGTAFSGSWRFTGDEKVIPVVVVSADHLRSLEAAILAADSFIENTQSCLMSLRKGILEGWEMSLLERHEREYLTQRAKLGEIS